MIHTYLETALAAAEAAGALLRENFGETLVVNAAEAYDVKLDLDVRSQELISRMILEKFPTHGIYGEEGISGNPDSELQWIIDPIDGTVNYFYNIPHFCISIALRERDEIIVGVILDPVRNELYHAVKGGKAYLNGKELAVSSRTNLGEAVISVGFSKSRETMDAGLPVLETLISRVRKCRLYGSAALDMAYIAAGRFDAYIEQAVSLWDIAAGKLLIEAAGGKVDLHESVIPNKYAILASSGHIDFASIAGTPGVQS